MNLKKIRIPVLFLAFFLILGMYSQNAKADTSGIISHTVTVKGGNFGGEATFPLSYDPRWLTVLPSYNVYPGLVKFASIISAGTYHDVYLAADGVGGVGEPIAMLESFGFKNYSRQEVTSPDGKDVEDTTTVFMASREDVIDNTEYTIFAIIVMGAKGIMQWASNLEMGDPDEFGSDLHPDWVNINNHKGFDVTATRVDRVAESYMNQYQKPGSIRRVLYTGHSRGAGVANILGTKHPDNSIAYAFAGPNTTKVGGGYSNIHNIVNANDLVSKVPTNHMGYSRYGQDIIYDASSNAKMQNIIESVGATYMATDLTEGIEALNRIWDKIINIEDYDIEDFDDDMDYIEGLLLIADATGSTGDILFIVTELLRQMPAIETNHYVVVSLAIASLLPEPYIPTPTPTPTPIPDPVPSPSQSPINSHGSSSISSATAPPNASGTIGNGESKTNISMYINNGNATIQNIPSNVINSIAAAGDETSIIIDVSKSDNNGKAVSKVTLTKATVENIVKALNSQENNKNSITIITNTASLKIDGKALASIAGQAKGANVQFILENKTEGKLNDSQRSAIEKVAGSGLNKNLEQIFELYIVSAGEKISDFGGGKVYIGRRDFRIPAGKNPRNFHVYYLPENGAPKRCSTWVEDGMIFFEMGNNTGSMG